jgi:hypothetical protein
LRSRLVEKARQEYAPLAWSVMKARYLKLMSRLTRQESRS